MSYSLKLAASIGDMPNDEVEDNEIYIRTAEHEVRQEEELGVENEAAHVTEAIINVEKIVIVTTKESARQVDAGERLELKILRGIFETKVHDDIPYVKNVAWKMIKRQAELVNSVTVNLKNNSESEVSCWLVLLS